jgi:hypothetical protein
VPPAPAAPDIFAPPPITPAPAVPVVSASCLLLPHASSVSALTAAATIDHRRRPILSSPVIANQRHAVARSDGLLFRRTVGCASDATHLQITA